MASKMVFRGHIDKKGQLIISKTERTRMEQFWSIFKAEEQIDITQEKHRKKRSLPQNSYYWGVVLPYIAKANGEDDLDDLHDDLKHMFNPKIKEVHGMTIEKGGSTTEMSTEEFSEYVDKVVRFAAIKLGIYIPDPGEG